MIDKDADLQAKIDRLEAIVRQAPAFIGLVDREMVLVDYNFTLLDGIVVERNEMIGKKVVDLHWWKERPELSAIVVENIQAAFAGQTRTMELENIHADGTPGVSEMRYAPLIINGQASTDHVIVTGVDITARVADREYRSMLLREVNHRVKNSLQIVSSILNLEASSSETEDSRERFKAAAKRVYAVSNVHDLIYRIDSFDKIPFRSYLQDLCAALQRSCEDDRRKIEIVCGGIEVDLATNHAISLALISNELITNAIKYAFVDRDCGRIDVRLKRSGDMGMLVVSDDGRGVTIGEKQGSTGLGGKLINALGKQIGGVVTIQSSDDGYRASVTFAIEDKEATKFDSVFME